ncbi:MAG TPA: hypothetical protein VMX12_11600 [Acidimicrobiia bacterium]|nr:hypothetical protein [Acidimicrobiia bacterium]
MSRDAHVRVGAVTPPAPPEVVAAIVAAITELTRRSVEVETNSPERGSEWVRASRLAARRAGLQRGSWRLAPRVGSRRGP